MKDKHILVVLGGVGPMAGLGLHKEIIMNTKVDSDQKHFRVMHLSFSSMVNDRCVYLSGAENIENPGEQMANIAHEINDFCKKFNSSCVIGVPCNTFHIDEIFNVFSEMVSVPNIKLLNMIDITVNYFVSREIRKVGLLSTTATRNFKLYHSKLDKNDIELVQVSDSDQDILQDLIFNEVNGLKTLSYSTQKTKNKLIQLVKRLKDDGAQAIILGCTEIPIALCENELFDIELLNPVKLLAREMITSSNVKKLVIK